MRELMDKGQVMTTEELKVIKMPKEEAMAYLEVEEPIKSMTRETIIEKTGLYGRRMMDYLEENQRDKMVFRMSRGLLLPEVEKRVKEAKELMISLEKKYLKEHLNSQMDYLTTVKIRNQARMTAEEIAMNQIIYQPL